MIRTRRPAADDREIFRLIRRQLIPLNPPELRRSCSNRELKQRLKRGVTLVWTPSGVSDVRVGGFIAFIVRGEELFVDLLAIDEGYQGGGVGGALLRRAEQYGISRGCRLMRLLVNDDNERGIRFYRKHGMVPAWYEMRYRSYVMEKRIG